MPVPDLPILHTELIRSVEFRSRTNADTPSAEHAALPVKILQFGTGALLRGLVDAFVDEANRTHEFGGRVVAVGSTGSGRSNTLNEQDGLYTLWVEGIESGRPVERVRIVASVARAISANEDWAAVLELARAPELACVVSNTTEVGIVLDEEDASATEPRALDPPRSFPGKLTACLRERAEAFGYAAEKGLVVLPCELIERNGERLREIVLTLAERWELGEAFGEWVREACVFPNTLVDRIVPGTPAPERHRELEERLGYRDVLLTIAEPYCLWAVEGDRALEERLPFLAADSGIVVAEDITPYRERKVRILNGTHTASVPTAFLAGCETMLDAMRDPHVSAFIRAVMLEEIVPGLDVEGGREFAEQVLDRFANPKLQHRLLDITLQSTSKMRVRVVPSIRRFYEKEGQTPERLTFGFAAYLRFMRATEERDGTFYGRRGAEEYPIRDDRAPALHAAWEAAGDDADALVRRVLGDSSLWGVDLPVLPGFAESVSAYLRRILDRGSSLALKELNTAASADGGQTIPHEQDC